MKKILLTLSMILCFSVSAEKTYHYNLKPVKATNKGSCDYRNVALSKGRFTVNESITTYYDKPKSENISYALLYHTNAPKWIPLAAPLPYIEHNGYIFKKDKLMYQLVTNYAEGENIDNIKNTTLKLYRICFKPI